MPAINRTHPWIIALLLAVVSPSALAVLNIEITKGAASAVPIAVVPFAWQSGVKKDAPLNVATVVRADLQRSGRFEPLQPRDMLAMPHADSVIDFNNWRIMRQNYLVVGTVLHVGRDQYRINIKVYDVFKGREIDRYTINATERNLRYAAHKLSDWIYQLLTGERGAFSTSVAFVTAQGDLKNRQYALWIADADGENQQAMLKSTKPILSPAWSPDGNLLAYSSLEDNGHQAIFVQVKDSGQRERVSAFAGLNGAPAWSPDGKSLAVSLSKDGNAEIYVLELATKRTVRLTNHWAIDTEPVWTPDGKSILFTSDRSGRPQIYSVSTSGGRVERLTFEGESNSRAAVSPDGKNIAMIHLADRKYRVAVQNLQTGFVRVLTEGVLDESPSFAPNGSMIIYATSTGGRGVLAAVSTDGNVHQRLTVQQADVREPAWSPFND